MKPESSRQIFEKKKVQVPSLIKIRSVGPELRTDGHDEDNSRFMQFCERA
jgi:hypothetical protein